MCPQQPLHTFLIALLLINMSLKRLHKFAAIFFKPVNNAFDNSIADALRQLSNFDYCKEKNENH